MFSAATLYAGQWPLALDVQVESWPIPVVKRKGASDDLARGEVLGVGATEAGRMRDRDGWASETDGVELLAQEEGDGIYTHYVRKTE